MLQPMPKPAQRAPPNTPREATESEKPYVSAKVSTGLQPIQMSRDVRHMSSAPWPHDGRAEPTCTYPETAW